MNTDARAVECLVDARWIVPVEPAGVTLTNHAVVIDGGRISEILPSEAAHARFRPRSHVMLPDHVLIPGLINLHTHAAMTLLRGLADDRALMEWLNDHIWPAEMQHVNDEFVYDGTRLACAEMLRGGITLFNDMYFFPQAAARAAVDSRMRAMLGMIVIEFPSPYAADAKDYLNKGLAVRDSLLDEPLLDFCFAPHAPYTVNDKTLKLVATYAGELDLPVHIHVHETRDEIEQSLKQHRVRPLTRIAEAGLLGPGLIAVHAVHLEKAEIALLAQHGCHVAHCPASNLKLASGIAPLTDLLAAGVNVGLGTDGAASNNRLDLFAEIRLAALLAKGLSGDATTVPAPQALELATIRPARALGLDAEIGSLVPGKFADMTAVRMDALELAPCYEPLSHLAYAAGREHVSHVWVNGELLLQDGKFKHIDTIELRARAQFWRDQLAN